MSRESAVAGKPASPDKDPVTEMTARWCQARIVASVGLRDVVLVGRRAASFLVSALVVGACVATPTDAPTTSAELPETPAPTLPFSRGGTLRIVVPANADTGEFGELPPEAIDPHRDFSFVRSGLNRCCLRRTLVSYNGLSVEEGGARLQPDLAASLPAVSADGLTWTVRLKEGLRYGPPLDGVEITATDFIRGFHRMLSPDLTDGFTGDFGDVDGAGEFAKGIAATISGLEAPDAHTLVIRLTRAQGDFGARLAEVGLLPLPSDPRETGAPDTTESADDSYWRYLVSTGPYMFEGAERLALEAPPGDRTLPVGLAPGHYVAVRNPSWDAATDPLRPAYPDRIELELVDSMEAAVARIDDGTADIIWNAKAPPTIPQDVFEAFQNDPGRGRAWVSEYSGVRHLIMNVALPPFDDIHVRRAMNWIVDKARLVDVEGGPAAARPYGHIVPDASVVGLLLDYDPFATPGQRGDAQKAAAEMAMSRYDGDGDGRCDAAACRGIVALTRPNFEAVAQAAVADLAKLGLEVEVQVIENRPFFESYGEASAKHAMWIGIGFFSLYLGPSGFLTQFHGPQSISGDAGNGTLVGATTEQLRGWGYEVTDVPNVDDRIEACIPLIGDAQAHCWAGVDQYLMENVVPYVPYSVDRFATITGPRVVHYGFDEQFSSISFDQFALAP